MNNALGLFLVGPGIVLLLTAFLAVTALIAGACGRLILFAVMGTRMAQRLSQGRFMLALWGSSALFLSLLGAAILFNIKVLALLGIVAAVSGLELAGLGMGVSAALLGKVLARALGRPAASPVLMLVLGVTTFALASIIPFLGWLVVLLAVLTGMGAVLDTLLRRPHL